MHIGVIGGTGPAGKGLVARLADLGHDVVLGSRDPARGAAIVSELQSEWGERLARMVGAGNEDAAAADFVILAVPWEGAADTAAAHAPALAGKVVVSMVNGLEKVGRAFRPILPPAGSVAEQVQEAAPDARVTSAFHLVPAAHWIALDAALEEDVIACADDDDARAELLALIAGIPALRAFDGGPLANSAGLEAFTSVMLTVNLRHKGRSSLRLLGVEPGGGPRP
jgi:NADPH-dependent F420 reductase